MTLDPSQLQSGVRAFLSSSAASPAAAAAAFAQVYDDFAQGAQFGASTPQLAGRKAAFAGTLAAGLVAMAPAPALVAALNAYWAAVPVVGVQSGVTAGCPGAAAVPGSLAVLLPIATKDQAVAALTGALVTATATVTATVAPPAGTVLPVS